MVILWDTTELKTWMPPVLVINLHIIALSL